MIQISTVSLKIDALVDQMAAGAISPDECKSQILEILSKYDLSLKMYHRSQRFFM